MAFNTAIRGKIPPRERIELRGFQNSAADAPLIIENNGWGDIVKVTLGEKTIELRAATLLDAVTLFNPGRNAIKIGRP